MQFLITMARAYPWQTALMVGALLLAGIMDAIGLSMLLPLLSIAVGRQKDPEEIPVAPDSEQISKLEELVSDAFAAFGITPTIGIVLTVIIVAIFLKSALMLLAKNQVGFTIARVATNLRLDLLRALLVTRWEYYLNQPVGGLTNAMATEAFRASSAYHQGIIMIAEFLQAMVYTCIALLVSWKTTLAALATGFIILYLLKHFVKKAQRAGQRQTDLLKSLITLMTDTLQSIKPLKAMARADLADFLLEKKTKGLNKAIRKQVFSKEVRRSLQEPLLVIFLAIGIYVILVHWRLPLVTVMVLVFLLARLIRQLNKVQERYQEMMVNESAYWALQETIQNTRQMQEPATGSRHPSLKRAIRLDHVSFAYDDQWVLKNASLTIPAGTIAAVAGPSGSGKTTVVDLMIGLLRPQEGEIWIDDLPLQEVDSRKWRRLIGYIPQDSLLLHDSVFNNVTLGDSNLSEDDTIAALRAAGSWEFVKSLPKGIHSIVGERGGKLSGGQRQRIAIARAIVHKPELLILDEATSALDPQTEEAICNTLHELRGDLTIITISHQPALAKIADRIYHIQDGKIVELDHAPKEGVASEQVDTRDQLKLGAASDNG
jgi:ATP-binding cassette subfamily C protein